MQWKNGRVVYSSWHCNIQWTMLCWFIYSSDRTTLNFHRLLHSRLLFKNGRVKATLHGYDLFHEYRMTKYVHGNSLSREWCVSTHLRYSISLRNRFRNLLTLHSRHVLLQKLTLQFMYLGVTIEVFDGLIYINSELVFITAGESFTDPNHRKETSSLQPH